MGAGISIWQAIKAKKSADSVKAVRDNLKLIQKNKELDNLLKESKRFYHLVAKYQAPPTKEYLKGVNRQKDIEAIESYLLQIKELSSFFKDKSPNPTTKIEKSINAFLNDFRVSENSNKLTEKSTQLCKIITDFISLLKEKVDTAFYGEV